MHDTATGLPVESDEVLNKRAGVAWKKVLGLIGYFDLDPNRALDVVLDLLISHVSSNHAFFIALLRQSPWCRVARRNPATLSASALNSVAREGGLAGSAPYHSFEDILRANEEYIEEEDETRSPLCAQMIGFKFAHYQVFSCYFPYSFYNVQRRGLM